jgi:hypothetical protein
MYARTAAYGLEGALWYTMDGPGWREGGLLDASQNPRPAYITVQFFASQLAGGSFINSDSSGAREGYVFRNAGRTYRIYWTNDASTVMVPLPAGAIVYNKFGQPITPSDPTTIPVTFDPILIESSN